MNTQKILITTPLCVPSYFNAGHRLALYQVAAHLRKQGHTVIATDIASLNVTWKDWVDLLIQNKFDVIAVMNDFDLIEGFSRLVQYIHEFSPGTKIITFGRLSANHSNFFQQFNIDGIVQSGDYEAGVGEFITHLEAGTSPAGVQVYSENVWTMPEKPGILLPTDQWILPNIAEINYASIASLYSADQRKFCGIPNRNELVVPMARGCPVGCNFCEVHKREGLKERRLPVEKVLNYIEKSFESEAFDYVSFYAPTFTLKRKWVVDLCEKMISKDSPYPWKCTTTMFHLDEELVMLMGKSGCFRISVGLESLEDAGTKNLPTHKHKASERFENLLAWCNSADIELNCFVIVGLPNTTVKGTQKMIYYLRSKNVRVRPSILADYSLIRPDMTEAEALQILGRHILPTNTTFSLEKRLELYKLVFSLEPNPTRVMDSIPKRE